MKFLDYEKLGLISEALATRQVGDKVLVGRVEAYSCKPASDDKKLIKELESTFREEGLSAAAFSLQQQQTTTTPYQPQHQYAASYHPHYRIPAAAGGFTPPSGSGLRPGSMPTTTTGAGGFSLSAATSSPLGDLTDAATRKLLINLIATMNAAFPDYDFSGVRPEQFLREPDLRLVMSDVNRHLMELCDIVSPTFLEELWAAVDEAVTLKDCEIYSYVPDMDGDPFSDGNLWSFNYFFVNRKAKRIVFFTCIAKSKFQSMDEEREEGADSDSGMMGNGGGGGSGEEYEEQYWVDL